jgi:hypothetical protein
MDNVVVLDAARTEPELGTAEQRVAVGASLLDKTVDGWWKPGRVDLEALDQRLGNRCVLGQLWDGNWITGLAALFEDMLNSDAPTGAVYVAAEHAGFWWNQRQNNVDVADESYGELTLQWRRAIVARRETWR